MGKIERLSASNQIPHYIIEALHEIRCEGNRSVHITKLSDGQWSSGSTLGKSKLKRVMTNIFELSQYLAFKVNHQAEKVQDWLEPAQTELAEHVYASLSGNRDATFSLAQRASSLMLAAQNNSETSLEKKQQWKILQRDLSYWLERAHRQGHQETWLMYANVYLNKQLILPIGHTIDNCFKSALKVDPSGDAAYQYGVYLVKHSQCERGFEFIKKSGEMSHHKAICFLQSKYYKKDQQAYLYWLNSGIEAGEKSSFTLDLAYKLGQWELDVNNDFLKKKAKTALIAAQSRQAPGVQYYIGYCNYHGYWGKPPKLDTGLITMMESHKSIPQFIHYQEKLFKLLNNEPNYIDEALDLSTSALHICDTSIGKAQIKFEVAMLIWKKLQNNDKAKSPQGIKNLIREAAKEGCQEAITFIKSPKGKALLRDGSVIAIKITHSHVDRKKQSKAKKSLRKSRRK